MNYKYYKKQKDFKLLYFLITVMFLSLVIFVMSISSPGKEITWQQIATTEFDATIITEEDGSQHLAVDISTPEQLAGIFTEEEKTYNIYENANSNNQSKTYAAAKTKKYIAKNVSEKDVKKYYFTTYDNHTSNDVATKLGNVYRLTKLLDLYGRSWIPADLSNEETFDGNGYTIRNLKISDYMYTVGFVACNYGTIKNVIMESVDLYSKSSCTSSSGGYMGAVCALNYGSIINCNAEGCYVKGFSNISSGAEACVGGITGFCAGLIQSCYARCNVKGGTYLGGIAGAINGTSTIKDCRSMQMGNSVYTNSSFTQNVKAGGIVGQTVSSTITGCISEQSVNVYASATIYCGGIVGYAEDSSISECANLGNVRAGYSRNTIYSTGAYVGGIAGYITGTSSSISNCKNNGNIIGKSKYEEILNNYSAFDQGFTVSPTYIEGINITSLSEDIEQGKITNITYRQTSNYTPNWDNKEYIITNQKNYPNKTFTTGWTTSDFCKTKGTVYKKYSGAFVGGIVGYAKEEDSINIERCLHTVSYNDAGELTSGNIEGNGYVDTMYSLYYGVGYKEYGNGEKYEYNLTLKEVIYVSGYAFTGSIVGYGGEVSKCYSTKDFAKRPTVSIVQQAVDMHGSTGSPFKMYFGDFNGGSEISETGKGNYANATSYRNSLNITISGWGTKNTSGFFLKDNNQDRKIDIHAYYVNIYGQLSGSLKFSYPIEISTSYGKIYHELKRKIAGTCKFTANGDLKPMFKDKPIDVTENNSKMFTIDVPEYNEPKSGTVQTSVEVNNLDSSKWVVKDGELTLKCFYWEQSGEAFDLSN